jgi:hypothetical protein
MQASDSDCGPEGRGFESPRSPLDHFRSSPPVSPLPVGVVDQPYLKLGVDPGDLAAGAVCLIRMPGRLCRPGKRMLRRA